MPKSKLLVVEDNDDMRVAVANYLIDSGFRVVSARSAEEAISNKDSYDCHVAVVDISLPGIDGLLLTKQLRESGFGGLIIALTARDTIEDKIAGLNMGMDDYMVKPFDLRELHARINAQLRSSGVQNDNQIVATKRFKIVPKKHQFFMDDKQIKLTIVEFRLLLRLMQNNHSTVTSQDLIEYVWGEDAQLSSPPIRIHMSNIRQKIKDDALVTIQTIPGVGYMFQD